MRWMPGVLQSTQQQRRQCDSSTDGTIYKYKARTLNGSRTVNFSDYAGKSVLFVNVATY
uniref:Glutathione peroxidase n=1 Tax=Salarias fasciatus TaxID=181472 RepID=A0A672GGY1_SALFA